MTTEKVIIPGKWYVLCPKLPFLNMEVVSGPFDTKDDADKSFNESNIEEGYVSMQAPMSYPELSDDEKTVILSTLRVSDHDADSVTLSYHKRTGLTLSESKLAVHQYIDACSCRNFC